MTFCHALRYPFQGQGWFYRLLVLACVQLIPIIGQAILVGYGLEIIRAVYANQSELPRLKGWQAFGDGLRVLLTGLLYCAPMLALAPLILSVGTTSSAGSQSNVTRVLMTIAITLILSALIPRLRIPNKRIRQVITGAVGVVPIVGMVSLVATMRTSGVSGDIQFSSLNGIGIVLSLMILLLLGLVIMGLNVGALRYAVEGKGLLDPTQNLRLLLRNHPQSRQLVLHAALIGAVTIGTTAAGLVILILPGLIAFTAGSIALWYCFARYGLAIGVGKNAS